MNGISDDTRVLPTAPLIFCFKLMKKIHSHIAYAQGGTCVCVFTNLIFTGNPSHQPGSEHRGSNVLTFFSCYMNRHAASRECNLRLNRISAQGIIRTLIKPLSAPSRDGTPVIAGCNPTGKRAHSLSV